MRRGTNLVAAAVTLACVVGLGACAQIPTSGPVRVGTADVETQVDIAMLPQGPTVGADPYAIVLGFLGAAVAATTSPKEFQTAREFLTSDVVDTWDPEASVRVVREPPVPEPMESSAELGDADTVEVAVQATAIATLDSAGAYTEVGDPRELDYRFTVTRSGGEWRISALDNGVLVPANLFANQYRATRLFFPAADDMESLVPDLRWFPRQSWRRVAVEELLAGPPEWLQGATQSLVPDGTQLASPSISESDDGEPVAVRLSEQISKAPSAQRSVIAEQISATLSEGAGRPVSVDLFSDTNRLAVEDADVDLPATTAQAMALKNGQLYLIDDGRVVEHELPVDLSGIDPTALAVSPVATPIVVRDGTDQIVSISPDGENGPVPILQGPDLAAPSIDNLGATWTSGGVGELKVYTAALEEVTVEPDWLKGRKVISVSVAPEGSRAAIVSETPTGTQVHVAGIVRDNEGAPVDLAATPLAVGAPVDDVVEARWSGLTTLALLTRDNEGKSGIWTAGVGGLAGTGGQSAKLPGLTDVAQMTAGVTDEGILVVSKDGDLEHEETGVWQPLAEDVDLVAYPG
ncbi:Lipoprotein LpqB beta-propeller domain-containing protein [Promicromonospora umidemergens]|uniref:LpqB family beta-propeller domain-containing protein n=1 Tax=Promicromonospora umidemergens TaxID=629679 RepID=A0ABP8YA51_9MICO|nr:GerMN domain-containing protein [Promicromonospora umidemergens]MCP2284697.1 Lipoprotein LpqB beta-propeller domain-containing protein [Promicromonospora umidemergens]